MPPHPMMANLRHLRDCTGPRIGTCESSKQLEIPPAFCPTSTIWKATHCPVQPERLQFSGIRLQACKFPRASGRKLARAAESWPFWPANATAKASLDLQPEPLEQPRRQELQEVQHVFPDWTCGRQPWPYHQGGPFRATLWKF